MSIDDSVTNVGPHLIMRFNVTSGDPAVEQVILSLQVICKRATLDLAIRVGGVVVEAFYSGDLTQWRKRGPKTISFRKLARHPKLPMSPASLYRSVAIYELHERLGARQWKHVSATHMRAVLRLPAERQRFWLETAEKEAWSARRLEEEITVEQPGVALRGGRRARHPLSKTIRILQRCLDDHQMLIGAEVRPEPSPESAQSILATLRQLQRACTSLESRMSRYVDVDSPAPA